MRRLPTSYLVAIAAGVVITASLVWLTLTVRVDELNGPKQYAIGAPEPAMAGGAAVGLVLIIGVLAFLGAFAFISVRELAALKREMKEFDELPDDEQARREQAGTLLRSARPF